MSADTSQLLKRLQWFRRLALVGAVLAAIVIVLGAWVRLTDAGLGCPDWPGCYGHLYPPDHSAGTAWHEMIHRYVASTLGLIIVALLIFAVAGRKNREQPLIPVALLFLVVCLQGALGALTVTMLLRPLIVTAHLFGGLTTMSLLWWLSIAPERRDATDGEGLRKLALIAALVLGLQIFLGGWTSTNYAAVACPDFPTCQRSWWPAMDFRDGFVLWRGLSIDYEGGILANPARMAIHVSHRLGAVVIGTLFLVLGAWSVTRGVSRRVVGGGVAVIAAVLLQIAIGIAMVHFAIPLPLATLHNAGAVLLVASLVWLLRALYPRPSVGVVTLTGWQPSPMTPQSLPFERADGRISSS